MTTCITLTKKQQTQTLSAKKAKAKITAKNVLAAPYEPHWPTISSAHSIILEKELNKSLPRLKHPKLKVPWTDIKHVPKEERKSFRLKLLSNTQKEINKDDGRGLILGINNVSKLLEKNLAKSILIANDVKPRLMVRHIIDQSVLYKVPMLVISNLRHILQRNCGIQSAVIALSDEIKNNKSLCSLHETISKIAASLPAPVNHINYNRIVSEELAHDPSTKENEPVTKKHKPNPVEEQKALEIFSQKYWLKRPADGTRAFIPIETDNKQLAAVAEKSNSLEFISLSPTNDNKGTNVCKKDDKNKHSSKRRTGGKRSFNPNKTHEDIRQRGSYKSLVVKRLKGDPNRNQKKIDRFKKK